MDIYDTCLLALERSQRNNMQIAIDPTTFAYCPNNSIDYTMMEKTNHTCMVPLAANWNNVGNWSSIWEVHDKNETSNVTKGNIMVENNHNCLIHSNSKLISMLGLDNIIVVETKNAMMITHKDRVQNVKKLINKLDKHNLS